MAIPEATFGDAASSPGLEDSQSVDGALVDGAPGGADHNEVNVPEFADVPHDEELEASADDLSGGDDGTPDANPGAEWFTEDVQQRVAAYGMSPEQALQFGNAESLQHALSWYDQQAYQAGLAQQQQWQQWQQYQQYNQAAQPQQPAPHGQQPTQPQQQSSPQSGQEGWKYKLELRPEDYGDEIVSAFNGLNDHYANMIQQMASAQQQVASFLAQSRAQYEQQQQQQQYQQYWNDLQAGVKELGEGFEDLFGKDVSQLTPNSAEYQNWHRLNSAMQTIIQGYQSQGLRVPSYKALVRNAVAFSFPNHLETRAKQQVTSKIKQRQRGFTARPSNAPSRPMSGEERAARNFDAFREQLGLDEYATFE